MSYDFDKITAVKSKFVAREVGDEMIIVPLTGNVAQMNVLFTLNETAKFIWQHLEEVNSVEELVQKMMQEFEIEKEMAEKDAVSFLEKLEITLSKAH